MDTKQPNVKTMQDNPNHFTKDMPDTMELPFEATNVVLGDSHPEKLPKRGKGQK